MGSKKSASNRSIRKKIADALKSGKMKQPALLVEPLFADANIDDLRSLPISALQQITSEAWTAISEHKLGKSVVNLSHNGPAENVTLVNIVTDNKPFLLDSVLGEITHSKIQLKMVLHPVVGVSRNKSRKITSIATNDDGERLSLIILLIGGMSKSEGSGLKQRLNKVLDSVAVAVRDWQPMIMRLDAAVESYRLRPPAIPATEIAEAVQFLTWLRDDHFTMLGIREYKFQGGKNRGRLVPTDAPALGILSDPDFSVLQHDNKDLAITPEIRDFLLSADPLIITKATKRSLVHRRTHMDYIGIKQYNSKGQLAGELRVVGLFTSTAYTRSVLRIPYLRRKADAVVQQLKADKDSHSGKALINVLETYPRDDLFQIDVDTLTEFAEVIRRLEERPSIRVLPRPDKFGRFVSVIVFVPRERYDTDNRIRIGEYLAKTYEGHVSAWYPQFLENNLTRVHIIIGRDAGVVPDIGRGELEAAVREIVRTWFDRLEQLDTGSIGKGFEFPLAYRDFYSPNVALDDLACMASLSDENSIAINFHPLSDSEAEQKNRIALKLFHPQSSVPLSVRVPMLENMGFRVIEETTYDITDPRGEAIFLHDMVLERADGSAMDLAQLDERLTNCFRAVWDAKADNDGFNALVLVAGLDWRECGVLRAYASYLRQLRSRFSLDYVWGTLARFPAISQELANLFRLRFDPSTKSRAKLEAKSESAIIAELESVSSLDDDRILRNFLNLLKSTLRTNYYQTAHLGIGIPPTLTFKFDPKMVNIMPQPQPYREIFVSSPRVEGLHLRFGPVARGGLRWSDRAQDYRTEVLGLVKAQQVKNAVIVPVGSKGGFYPKQLPQNADRDAVFHEGREAYKVFISAMLSVTDNLVDGKIVPPKNTVRHDGDDPYFVVAADKGTATFSDTANAISQSHDFWLDDAFASGGSAGYDHKVMGITARGGWEAVKRHFREIDRDIQNQAFTVVGVGDMSGDVFGNGMLLSRCTKIIAAFDHRDIFIDPDPDMEASFKERQRLFKLPRSSWADYNAKLISKGGGVFSKSKKSIDLPAAAASAIGLEKGSYPPATIINAILKADVDLMWFGGIGTYIRASSETDLDVGDRGNDNIRITAAELRVKVIGEGANLGITQKARIEFNTLGGRCNSDAIDNSAGVNSSDVEVNIKIALSMAMKTGRLTLKKRNTLLVAMTEEVAGLVLRNNYLQTLAVSLAQRQGMADFGYQWRFMQQLEARGKLDRDVEDLPDEISMAEHEAAGQPLVRAEIGVLLAYAKIVLLDDLVDSDVPDLDYLHDELMRYFPSKMRKTYLREIDDHRLRREIIATVLANSMINRGGPTYLTRAGDRTGATPDQIARAYVVVRDGFSLQQLNGEIDALDTRISGTLQLELYQSVQDLVLAQTVWFLRYTDLSSGLSDTIARVQKARQALSSDLGSMIPEFISNEMAATKDRYVQGGVGDGLANSLAGMPITLMLPDIMLVAETGGANLQDAASAFFAITEAFKIGRIEQAAKQLSAGDYYDGLALDRALQLLSQARRDMTVAALKSGGKSKGADPVSQWLENQGSGVERVISQVSAIVEGDRLTVSRLTVAANLLGDLVKS